MSTKRFCRLNLVLSFIITLLYQSTSSVACNMPTNLRASSYGPNSITITWDGTSTTSFELRYVVQGGNLNFAPVSTITSNPYTITGLSINTTYAIQVREVCTTGNNPWPGFLTAKTSCAVQNAPFTASFDGGAWVVGALNTAGAINSCWQRSASNPSITWKPGPPAFASVLSGPNSSRSGTGKYMQINRAGFDNTWPDSSFFESPLVDLSSLTNPQLKYWYHMFGANIDQLDVYVSSDLGQSYTLLQTLSGQQQTANTDNWIEVPISLSAYANDTVRIRFKYSQATFGFQNQVSIDDFSIAEAPTCARPISFTNTYTTNDDAYFSWTTGGATNWQISYGSVGFSPNSGTIVNVNSNPGSISGLTANTTYEAYIRDSCGTNDVSVWTGPISFKTKCNPVSTPYTENFDGSGFSPGTTFGSLGAITSCWSRAPLTNFVWVPGPPTFTPTTTGPQGDHTTGSGQYMFTESVGFSGPSPMADLESPLISLVGLSNPQLSFYLHAYGSGISDLKTYINDGSGWVLKDTQTGEQQSSKTDSWKEIIISLSANVGDTISVRFVGTRMGNSTLSDIAIDDITIDEAPSCPRPQNLALLGVTATTADLQWLSGGANNWNLSYGSPGFTANNGTIVNVNSNPGTLTGLTSNTTYEVYVRDSCAVGDVSIWTGPITFSTACTPVAAPYLENFDGSPWVNSTNFTLGSLDPCWSRTTNTSYFVAPFQGATALNASGPSNDHTTGTGKYLHSQRQGFGSGILFSEVTSPQVDVSTLTSPELRFWYHMYGTDIDKLEVAVSNGGAFTTINTITGQQQTSKTAAWLERVVSLSAYSNDTISVRFRFYRNNAFSFFAQSAIDDVRIDNTPTCPRPTNLSVTSSTVNSINLSWTTGGATNWQFRYRPAGSTGAYTTVNATSNPFTITGLNPSSSYEIFVRDSCAAGDVSLWTGPLLGQTACGVSTIPYLENFDNNSWVVGQFGNNFGDQINSCWSRPSNTSNDRWGTLSTNIAFGNGPSADASGGGKFINFNSVFGTTNSTITSPQIAIVNSSNPYLYFKYHMFGSDIGDLQVRLNTLNNGNNITIKTISGQQQTSKTAAWIEDSVDLSSYIGDTISVIFRASSQGFRGDISVDDMRIENLGPSCGAPINLSLTNATYTSIDFSWLSTNTGAVTNLRWYPASSGPTAATVVNNVTSPYSLNNLTASSDYVIEVFDSCGTLASNPLIDTLSTLFCDTVTAGFSLNGRFLRRSFTSTSTNADSLFWQFGSLDSSFITTPSYSFPAAGVYTITLIAYNDCGNVDTLITNITICDTLRANFTNSFANDSTRFYANPSNNASGYSWDLDDGFTATGDSVGVKYNDSNTKIVTLTSWNDCGDTVRNTRNIPGCLPPVADWTYTILSPINAGLRIQFDASLSTNGSNYSWDFGDGNTGTGINPIHIYSTPGLQYKVKLTVTNNCGGQDIREFRLNQIGIEEFKAHASVRIYPNPADEFIYIDYGSLDLELKSAKIYDSKGRLVLSQKLDNSDKYTINSSYLSPGLYQIRLETNYGFINDKILIK